MTTDTHDTAAALWSAIDAYGCDAASHGALGKDATTRTSLHRAITAHVEAEVARRLAAAPDVEAAIGDFDDACSSLMRVRCEETPPDAREPAAWDESLLEVYRERKASLLAAIAADKARAVEAATAVTNSLEAIRVENEWPEMAPVDALSRVLAQRAAYYGFMRDAQRQAARPTPDEARRLVEAYGRECELRESERDPDARTALLRALGVEA